MIALNDRAKVAYLLSEHELLTEAIDRLDFKKFQFGLTVSNEKNDSEFVSVGIDRRIARTTLQTQLKSVVDQLIELGVELE